MAFALPPVCRKRCCLFPYLSIRTLVRAFFCTHVWRRDLWQSPLHDVFAKARPSRSRSIERPDGATLRFWIDREKIARTRGIVCQIHGYCATRKTQTVFTNACRRRHLV